MTPRFVISCLALLSLVVVSASAQQAHAGSGERFITVQPQLQQKLADGRLVLHASRMLQNASGAMQGAAPARLTVAVYADREPAQADLDALAATGVVPYPGTWTPPMANHPRGFYLADMQPARLNDVLALDCVQQLGTAEGVNRPMNNVASRSIRANAAWSQGWTGKGVKVGVLDSGIDTSYQNGEFPACFDRKDYSKFPALGDDVINRITPHGTHVTGTAVGRGILSAANTGNEGGAYRGMAPEACLAFIRIGDDSSAGASDAVIIGALNDMVTKYHARVINLSYGGWSTYHDGSEALEQKADWAYTQGTAVVFAAGNSATGGRHSMGTVPANSESDFIEVHSWNIGADQSRLSFNLVWFDGIGTQRKLSLRYFDTNKVEITNLNVAPTTESARGTQSQYSSMRDFMKAGNSTFFLKVVNASAVDQEYHLYEDWFESTWKNQGVVTFSNASSAYTICAPSTADHVLSIAAYCDRSFWTGALGWMNTYSQGIDKLATFSSRGPRVDNWPKPDIAAPGTALISVRDTNMSHVLDNNWIDDDGTPGGPAHYTPMQGTSMATPVATGAVAVVLSKYPFLTPQQVYDSLRMHAVKDNFTGATPNNNWGAGKLDLGFLSGLPAPSGGGWELLPTGWDAKELGDFGIDYRWNVYATVGKPFTNDSTWLMKSNDDGSTWKPVLAGLGLLPFAAATNNPRGDTSIYTAQRFGGHIFRSTNFGGTWSQIGDALDYTALLFADRDSLLVAATHGQGVRVSMDRGITWQVMNNGIPDDAQVPHVADGMDGWLYAGVNINGSVKLYRLHRSSMMWTRADAGIDTTKNINACAVMPDGTVFAIVSDRVYRSADHGASWTQIAILNDYLQGVRATSNSTVLVSTIGAGVYRSNDRGRTWDTFNDGLTTLNIVKADYQQNSRRYGYASGKPGSLFRRKDHVSGTLTLGFPVDGAVGVPSPVRFSWSDVGGTYALEVSRDSAFTSVVTSVNNIATNAWAVNALPVLTTLYWRVRAEGEFSSIGWTAPWRFTTADQPPATPLQLAPADRNDSVYVPVTYTWVPAPAATSYGGETANDSLFSEPLRRWTASSTRYTDSTLEKGKTFYWHIRALNAGGVSAWSPVWRFATLPDTGIDAAHRFVPLATSPSDDAHMVPINAYIEWLPTTNARAYQFQLSAGAAFTDTIQIAEQSARGCIVATLPYHMRIFWRVRAGYISGWSDWSPGRSFVTTLAGPQLQSPTRNATGVSITPTLAWDSTAGATMYEVSVALDAHWNVVVFDSMGIQSLSYKVPQLQPSTAYFWRVRGANARGLGTRSEEWMFTTSPNTGVVDPFLASAFLLEQPYPNPASDVTMLRFRVLRDTDVTLQLFDLFGREALMQQHLQLPSGTHERSIDVHALIPGVYVLHVSSGASTIQKAITILR